MMATLHGIGDMNYWYSQHVRNIPLESATNWSVRNWATTIWNLGYEYYRICHTLGMTETDWKCRCRVIATNFHDFTLRILDTFPNAQSFADGIASSSFLPGFISNCIGFIQANVYTREKHILIDGGFGYNFVQYNPSNDVVHFSLRHSKTVNRKNGIYDRIHYSILDDINLLNDNWGIVTNMECADRMFDKGYEFGIRNMAEIVHTLKLE